MALHYSLTPAQFDEVAEKLEMTMRADMSVLVQEATGGKAKINVLDLFEILGMVQVRLAQSMRKMFPREEM